MNSVEQIPANVVPITKALATVMRELVGKAVKELADRLRALEERVTALPVAEKGERGDRGEPGQKGEPGIDGKDGVDGAAGAIGARGEKGDVGDRGTDGVDGKDGTDGTAGINGKDGAPGGDAIELEILPAIDERKSYPRGIYATYRGGLWRSFQTTNGLNGWDCIVQGVESLEMNQVDQRFFEVVVQMSVTTKTFGFVVPQLIERGVFKQGESYACGDGVTYAGAYWIAKRETTEKPGEQNDAWRLAVKSGRNGRDGERTRQGPEGKAGRDGRDLTQIDPTTGRKWVMAAFPLLIPLQKAKAVCRVVGSDDDERIDEYRKQAQKIVIDYCKVTDDYWDVTLPLQVDAAMKLGLINLYEGEPPLSDAVVKLLERSRDPALA